MESKLGETISLQIAEMGEIDLSSDFSLKEKGSFLVKNDNDETIELTVRLAAMDDFITTRFYAGWNCELVREIKAANGISNIKYGR